MPHCPRTLHAGLWLTAAFACHDPDARSSGELDRRRDLQQVIAAPKPAQLAAIRELEHTGARPVVATYDPSTAVTRTLMNPLGALLPLPAVTSEEPAKTALSWAKDNLQLLGLEDGDLEGAELCDRVPSAISGTIHLYYCQTYQGIRVFNAQLQLNLTKDGSLASVNNSFLPGLRKLGLEPTPEISAQDAIVTAAESIGAAEDPAKISVEAIEPTLMWLPVADSLVLVWRFQVHTADGRHVYDFSVDAKAPDEVWMRHDWVSDASYTVYAPPAESPNHAVPAPPADGRTALTDPFDPAASPLGWHDNGTTSYQIMRGNNVHAYEDRDANNYAPGTEPTCGANLACTFPVDLTSDPSAYINAAVANTFFWTNRFHDIQYLYGFDAPGGNFQVNNFGLGGLGGDDVRAEALDGTSFSNANFMTPPDGQRPRMQMYLWDYTTPLRTSDFDNGILVHENAHGLSERIVGGPSNVTCLNNNQTPSEGWSDWYALVHTAEPGDLPTDRRGIGTYVRGQSATGTGLRGQPYSTDPAVNTWTYQSINGLSIPHGVGSVWGQALWEVYWALVNAYGFSPNLRNRALGAGNHRALVYVTEGMKFTACDPTFADARDGIIQAAANNFGGADVCLVWRAFAAFGLGINAVSGGSNSTSPTNGFQLPAQCQGDTPPIVFAGFDQTASLPPGLVSLDGTITDPGSTPSAAWTVDAQPAGATVIFANPNNADTQVTFSAGGTYVLRLTANDGVNPPASDAIAVTVSAIASVFSLYSDTAASNGSWTSHNPQLRDPQAWQTSRLFRLTGSGAAEGTNYARIQGVNGYDAVDIRWSAPQDIRPFIGGHIHLRLKNVSQLATAGVAVGFGLSSASYPDARRVKTFARTNTFVANLGTAGQWFEIKIPFRQSDLDAITWDGGMNITAVDTLRLGGNNVTGSAQNPWIFEVDDVYFSTAAHNAPANTPPVVDAGLDQTITLPANVANLDGTVTDPGDNPTALWTVTSGPAGVSFANASAVDGSATFPAAGIYVLTLTANDGVNAPVSDSLTITVNPAQGPQAFEIYSDTAASTGSWASLNAQPISPPGWSSARLTALSGSGAAEGNNYLRIQGVQTYDGVDIRWSPPADIRPFVGGHIHLRVKNFSQLQTAGAAVGFGLSTATYPDTRRVKTFAVTNSLVPNLGTSGQWFEVKIPFRQSDLDAITWDGGMNITQVDALRLGGNNVQGTAQNPWIFEVDDVYFSTEPYNVISNVAPVVDAGANQTMNLPLGIATLDGTVSDPDSTPSTLWTVDSSPGGSSVVFGNSAAVDTTATVNVTGSYVLRLTANDGVNPPVSDTVTITLGANQQPVVDAGADQTITLPASAALDGTVTDPSDSPGTLWQRVTGPPGGSVLFGDSTAVDTSATFSAAGVYVLSLTANDGVNPPSSDMVWITVNPAPVDQVFEVYSENRLSNGAWAAVNPSIQPPPAWSTAQAQIQTGSAPDGDEHLRVSGVQGYDSVRFIWGTPIDLTPFVGGQIHIRLKNVNLLDTAGMRIGWGRRAAPYNDPDSIKNYAASATYVTSLGTAGRWHEIRFPLTQQLISQITWGGGLNMTRVDTFQVGHTNLTATAQNRWSFDVDDVYFTTAPATQCNGDCLSQRATAALPACTIPVLDAFLQSNIQPPGRDSGAYSPPAGTVLTEIAASLGAVRAGDANLAVTHATAAGYTLCREPIFSNIALWRPSAAGTGHAVFAWRVYGARPLIVEAPHPYYETDTDTESVTLFDRLDARVLILAGAHRCASLVEGICSGSTSVCGPGTRPYRISDMAHVENAVFQEAHVFLANTFTWDWVLNLHGMSDVGVSVSQGTVGSAGDQDAVARIGAALMAAFPAEQITSCNPFPGAVVQQRLCGTDNAQGRHVNGSANACTLDAFLSAGRFVHMEQSLSIRQQQIAVSGAIGTVLPPPVN